MSIQNNRLTPAQYEQHFSDIHPPFENRDAALVEANRAHWAEAARAHGAKPER